MRTDFIKAKLEKQADKKGTDYLFLTQDELIDLQQAPPRWFDTEINPKLTDTGVVGYAFGYPIYLFK